MSTFWLNWINVIAVKQQIHILLTTLAYNTNLLWNFMYIHILLHKLQEMAAPIAKGMKVNHPDPELWILKLQELMKMDWYCPNRS